MSLPNYNKIILGSNPISVYRFADAFPIMATLGDPLLATTAAVQR